MSEDEALACLPSKREPWSYYPGADPDWQGFQGFIATTDEIDRLVAAFAGGSDGG